MRRDLVKRAEGAEAEGKGLSGSVERLPAGEPKARPVGLSGVPHVGWSGSDRPRAKPWQVSTGAGAGAYLARVSSPAEGAAVVQAFEAVSEKLRDVSPKAMRQTVKRLAGQRLAGQLPLPLGDGLDGEG